MTEPIEAEEILKTDSRGHVQTPVKRREALEIGHGRQAVLAPEGAGESKAIAVLSFSGSLKVFVALEGCNMRKGFNGLHAMVTESLGGDP